MVQMDICTEYDHANNYGGDNNNGVDNKFSCGLCELYNKKIHGYIPGVSDPNINGHYLVIYGSNSSSSNDSNDTEDDVDINDIRKISFLEYYYGCDKKLTYKKYILLKNSFGVIISS